MGTRPADVDLPLVRKVFVSSTSVDLKAFRLAVRDVLARMGQSVEAMETFGAHDSDATSVSLAMLRQADVYIGVVAWRYGHIPEGQSESVTHLEYREAVHKGMARYVFLAAEDTDLQQGEGASFPASVRDPENRDKLIAFRNEILEGNRVIDTFDSPEDLAFKVAGAINRYLIREKDREREREREPDEVSGRPMRPKPFIPFSASFFGRERESEELCSRLLDGENVGIASVSGLAGVGKSALAQHVLLELQEDPRHFPRGMAYVPCKDLVGYQGLALAYDAVLTAWQLALSRLGTRESAALGDDATAFEQTLQARLNFTSDFGPGRHALVLLDNVELSFPIRRALEFLWRLGFSVLVTSRHVLPVPGLATYQLDTLDTQASMDLLLARFRAALGGTDALPDSASQEDIPVARVIVDRLGNLPLAVELAAARAAREFKSLRLLCDELRAPDVLRLLSTASDRTVSILYSFGQSFKLLSPAQQLAFAALGATDVLDWPRPCVDHVLAAAAACALRPGEHARDALDALVSLSLVSVAAPQALSDRAARSRRMTRTSEETRVRLHPLLHDYAKVQWQELDPWVQIAMQETLQTEVLDFISAHQTDFYALAEAESFVAAALRSALDLKVAEDKVARSLRLLESYFVDGGHWRLGQDLVSRQLEPWTDRGHQRKKSQALCFRARILASVHQFRAAQEDLDEAQRCISRDHTAHLEQARIELQRGVLARLRGDFGPAEMALNSAKEQAKKTKDNVLLAEVWNELGMTRFRLNNDAHVKGVRQTKDAGVCFEQARSASQSVQDLRGEGHALFGLGLIEEELSVARHRSKDEARQLYLGALNAARVAQDKALELQVLNRLSFMGGGADQAMNTGGYIVQALNLARELGDRFHEYRMLQVLLGAAEDQERRQAKQGYLMQALAVAREMHDEVNELDMLIALAQLSSDTSQTTRAGGVLASAVILAHRLENDEALFHVHLLWGRCLRDQVDLEGRTSVEAVGEARDHLLTALRVADHLDDVECQHSVLLELGKLESQFGDPLQAQLYFGRITEQPASTSDPVREAEAHYWSGHNKRRLGDTEGAKRAFEDARERAQRTAGKQIEARALEGLGYLALDEQHYVTARNMFESALELAPTVDAYECLEREIALGKCHEHLRDYPKAEEYISLALDHAQQLNQNHAIPELLERRGGMREALRDYEAAQRCYAKAFEVLERLGDHPKLAKLLTAMARVAENQGNRELAAMYRTRALLYEDAQYSRLLSGQEFAYPAVTPNMSRDELLIALNASQVTQDHYTAGAAAFYLGQHAHGLQHYREAVRYYITAKDQFASVGDNLGLGQVFSRLGELFYATRDFKSAEFCLLKAESYLKDTADFGRRGWTYVYLARISERPSFLQRRVEYFQMAEQFFQRIDDKQSLDNIRGEVRETHERLHKWQSAHGPRNDVVVIPGPQVKRGKLPRNQV